MLGAENVQEKEGASNLTKRQPEFDKFSSQKVR